MTIHVDLEKSLAAEQIAQEKGIYRKPVYRCIECNRKNCSKRNQICDVCHDEQTLVADLHSGAKEDFHS